MSSRLIHGDCLAAMRELADASVDAMATDPPAGISFMGKEWDDFGEREGFVRFMTGVMVEALRVLKPGAHSFVWAIPRTSHWTAWAIEDAGFEIRDIVTHHFGSGFPKSLDVAKQIIDGEDDEDAVFHAIAEAARAAAANHLDGRGTALKPATEFWILARKPLDGTVIQNVLRHETGALNIDGCRIGYADAADLDETKKKNPGRDGETVTSDVYGANRSQQRVNEAGRWPANLILSHSPWCAEACAPDCAVAAMDAVGDGASRFFYVAKPSTRERDAGLEDFAARSGGEATDRKDGSAGLNSPRAGAGRRGGRKNIHPTVKPIELMRHLVRLITPPGGLVLDPFAGSGTAGIACAMEGIDFIGIEREEEYAKIAEARIAGAIAKPEAA